MRLSDDELTALLAEHPNDEGCCGGCFEMAETDYAPVEWPCETWRLATEVRDLRAALRNDEEIIGRPRNGHIHTWYRDSPNMAVCIFCCTGFPRGQHMPLFRVMGEDECQHDDRVLREFMHYECPDCTECMGRALARYEEGGR